MASFGTMMLMVTRVFSPLVKILHLQPSRELSMGISRRSFGRYGFIFFLVHVLSLFPFSPGNVAFEMVAFCRGEKEHNWTFG